MCPHDRHIKRERVYLNNASIGPCSTRVMTAMTDFLSEVQTRGRRSYPSGTTRRGVGIMNEGGVMWVAAVNLIIWTGLFLYLLNIERKIRQREKDP